MSFRLDLSGQHYQEKIEPNVITRNASLKKDNQQGLVGISQLTNLFFNIVKQQTGLSIKHSNFINIDSPNFVAVNLQNLKGRNGWKEEPSSRYLNNGAQLTKWVNITITPELDQKEFLCNEATLIEKSQQQSSDMPETCGLSAYVLDTIHEWTLILIGNNQAQTFTLRVESQEANF